MKIKSVFLFIFLLISAFLGGCNTDSSVKTNQTVNKNEDKKLTIFTTIFPIEDFTKKIGGQHVEVKSVYPAGADAHTFEPTMRAMMDIADADLFIFNGNGLEPFIDKTKSSLANEKATMVEASTGIELLSRLEDHDHGHEATHDHDEADHEDHDHTEDGEEHHDHDKDPHIWLEPSLAIKMAENIKEALTEAMPSAKDDFAKNFQDIKQKLEQIDKELQQTVKAAEHKEILVSHASYGYWEHRYGLKQISISGLSPENEPSQKQLQKIIETAKEHQLSYIIYDQNAVSKVADVVKKETGTTPVILHNLEYITENDLKNNEDYFSIMNKNVEILKTILGTVENDHDHEHSHAQDEETEKIYAGYFEDSQVKDRSLSDWEGDWQSVYPYLQDGTLDEVFTHKAEHDGYMTDEEYKEYYNKGYQTDVDRILIKESTVTFFKNGEVYTGEYLYDGYEILTYDKGNRGVRYIFKLAEETEGLPQYIQFSDHSIYPNEAGHYHLYWGDDRKALLDEVTHWPTYYPSEMDGHDIAHEMMAH
ncbi:metal ABC transporter solute-binding protein, Zn/Mn family [Lederbergia citrea]|uniref:metal ABC transporter solute-binding protein, Zn/Mn family n=1 Tax=Lederbergia citrea TaxID=2833581 RepID=UPI001BC96B07|nr:zinc ABC transporter substrate-binding protein AdcA [Lederbergia citrea]MBS4176974.1 zinc ABC transporter substrate-binding protein AdcA [Lederbergia citrea]